MTRILLAVLNPRDITASIENIAQLPVDKLWISRMTETRVTERWPDILELAAEYTHLSVISDDTIIPRDSWDALTRHLADTPVTGWCNLQEHADSRVNLSDTPLTSSEPHDGAYTFPTAWDVLAGPETRRTYFTGMCLTTMPVPMWHTHPFHAYGHPGHASDYHLSYRLQQANVPVLAVRPAFVKHLKATWNTTDRTAGRELLIGREPEELILQHAT